MFKKTKPTFREEHYLPKRQAKRPKRGASAAEPRRAFPLILSAFLWAAFLGTGVYIVFFSPFLLIKEVKVGGNERIRSEELSEFFYRETAKPLWYVFSPRNYFFFPRHDFERRLREDYPDVERIELKKFFPETLSLQIEERSFGILWCSGGPCYLLDRDSRSWEGHLAESRAREGFRVFRITDTSGLPVTVGESLFDYPYLAMLEENLSRLEGGLSIPVEWEGASSSRFSDELRLKTKSGWELYVNTRIPPEENEKTLRLFFEREIPFERQGELRYVDLRAENRIYYALKGEEGKSEEEKKEEEKKSKEDEKKEDKKRD